MQSTESQEFLLEILRQAEEGKSIEFRLITSWSEFKFFRKSLLSTKLVVRALNSGAKTLFKDYCKDITTGSADFTQLLAYAQLKDIISFYERDIDTLKKMLDKYDDYLGQGHFWFSFLGGERVL
jgi:hypothetical protein